MAVALAPPPPWAPHLFSFARKKKQLGLPQAKFSFFHQVVTSAVTRFKVSTGSLIIILYPFFLRTFTLCFQANQFLYLFQPPFVWLRFGANLASFHRLQVLTTFVCVEK